MTYLEVILAIAAAGEKVILERLSTITTDKRSYFRDGDGWEVSDLPILIKEEHDKFIPIVPTGETTKLRRRK